MKIFVNKINIYSVKIVNFSDSEPEFERDDPPVVEKIRKKIFFEKFFSFAFKNTLKSSQHEKLEKKFFGVKSDFSLSRLTDQRLVQQF